MITEFFIVFTVFYIIRYLDCDYTQQQAKEETKPSGPWKGLKQALHGLEGVEISLKTKITM
jgi:hypothetical protein